MKITLFNTTLLLMACLLFSCTGEPKKATPSPGDEKRKLVEKQAAAQETLYDEVIAIHDDVMPKMSDINRIKRALKVYKDGLKPGKCEFQAEDHEQITKMIAKLDEAEEAMMGWMRSFKQPEQASYEERMAYLETEKVSISEVSDLMYKHLDAGEVMLKNLPKL